MEEPSDLQDWEVLSDSDTNSVAFEGIIHSDYFALDSTKLHAKNECLKEIEFSEKNLMNFQPQTEKGGSFLVDDSQMEVGFEGIMNSDAGISELGIEEIAKSDSFQADDLTVDSAFEETELSRHPNCSLVDSEHELGIQEIQKGGSFMVNESEMEVGVEEIDSINQSSDGDSDLKELRRESNDEKSQDLCSDSSIEMSSAGSTSVVPEGEKVLIWWKLPLDILKLCASRVRPVWSIPIAAAVIGILMVGRRLYKMKHRNRSIPLKVSFEDKKAASQILLHSAGLNEVVVRRIPIGRSPLLPAGGLTPWPVVGLL